MSDIDLSNERMFATEMREIDAHEAADMIDGLADRLIEALGVADLVRDWLFADPVALDRASHEVLDALDSMAQEQL